MMVFSSVGCIFWGFEDISTGPLNTTDLMYIVLFSSSSSGKRTKGKLFPGNHEKLQPFIFIQKNDTLTVGSAIGIWERGGKVADR